MGQFVATPSDLSIRIHRHCNRRILTRVITSGMVAVSRIRCSYGSRACGSKRQLAASLAGAGGERPRASFTRGSGQGNTARWLVRGHVEVQRRGGDAGLAQLYRLTC